MLLARSVRRSRSSRAARELGVLAQVAARGGLADLLRVPQQFHVDQLLHLRLPAREPGGGGVNPAVLPEIPLLRELLRVTLAQRVEQLQPRLARKTFVRDDHLVQPARGRRIGLGDHRARQAAIAALDQAAQLAEDFARLRPLAFLPRHARQAVHQLEQRHGGRDAVQPRRLARRKRRLARRRRWLARRRRWLARRRRWLARRRRWLARRRRWLARRRRRLPAGGAGSPAAGAGLPAAGAGAVSSDDSSHRQTQPNASGYWSGVAAVFKQAAASSSGRRRASARG